MKNWKDKVLGIFAGIGLMSLLMGFQSNFNIYNKTFNPETNKWVEASYEPNPNVNQSSYSSSNGRYTMTVYRNQIARMDTQTGQVVVWRYNGGWVQITH